MAGLSYAEMEKLVRLITEQILQKLGAQPATKENPEPVVPGATAAQANWPKRLITAVEVEQLAKSGIRILLVPQRLIITPAAADELKRHGLLLKTADAELRSPVARTGSSRVAILAPSAGWSQIEAIKSAVSDSGLELGQILTQIPAYRVANALKTVTDSLASGEISYGIVLDEGVFQLCIRANRSDKVRAIVCWDRISARLSQAESGSNLLFLPNHLFGLPVLKEIAGAWLAQANTHQAP